ncbi:MAG: TonB family protein [Vicinamibacterales bacterium]
MLTLFGRDLLTPAGILPSSPQSTSFLAMPDAKPVRNPHRRSVPSGLAVSITLHLLAAASVLYLQQAGTLFPKRPVARVPPRLVSLVYVPDTPLELPVLPLPTPLPPAQLEVRTEEPRPELPAPLPPRTVEVAPKSEIGTANPSIGTPKGVPYVPAPPKPAPEVVVGTFGNNAVARTPQPNREVEKVAFDNPSARAAVPKAETTTLGGFDRPPAREAPPNRVDPVVTQTGFGSTPAAAPAAPESRVVRDAGFGNSNSRERPRPAEPAVVTPSGFADARDTQAVAKVAPPPKPTVTPVEVLSKPTPVYTDEARRLKIEGDVMLEVEFSATGSVRVLRVIRGLGHGLDESAARAAEQIKFKPAQDSGRAVDYRATVHIVFRLA